ncbi:uncharacterized protein LOC116005777 [Ipomoea triloba]|uniref:uncharacterized protein LOC116005777 n=1 Tax=Ipomoea triloba TaxID=35885 RepID=UPI00125DB955|nr:uncharacterized protein LOC116005777 [Ipomoea triloba]
MVSYKKPDFVFLMETKVGRIHAERLRVKLGFDGLFYVDNVGLSGGLALFWKSNNTARLLSFSRHHIDVEHEKRGHNHHPKNLLRGFGETLDDCGLHTLHMEGYLSTWERGRGTDAWVEERLDRVLATDAWRSSMPFAKVVNTLSRSSDHSIIFLDVRGMHILSHRVRKCFRFEMAWLLDEGCRGVVEEAWQEGRWQGLQDCLLLCGERLKAWGGDNFHKFGKNIKKLRGKRQSLQGHTDHASVVEFKRLDGELSRLEAQEDVFWRQRAKQHWLRGADANTKFYHHFASARKKKNTISKLKDDLGNWLEGENFHPLILSYYENIFTASGTQDMTSFPTLSSRVTSDRNVTLLLPFTVEELKTTLFSMFLDKAPGPDWMNPSFYQHFWDVVGNDVTDFVLNCIHICSFPCQLNDANVVLIPKKNPPEVVSSLRPIALCNVIYKIMAKMIANRIKPLMSLVISESQSAFIPNRLITDNILLTAEVGHYLNRKQLDQTGWAALKLDMAKTYDRMEWVFLCRMLETLGFDPKWIELIMLCVTTVRYRILINGLSQLIQQAQATGTIHGCRVARGAPAVSHLFFADDSLLFFKANLNEAAVVKHCLQSYELFSGQAVNFQKSSVCFSRNTGDTGRVEVANTLGVVQAADFGKYLGLPSFVGRNKRRVFAYIEDKIRQRIGSWNKKLLSRAGKEILLKSVAQSMPTFLMSVFLLPDSLCVALERLMNRFWWGTGGHNEKGIHWMSWKRMCTPKSLGGLGFKDLRAFNLALLGKQGWRFLINPACLVARVYKARYFPNSSFVDATVGANPSACWRGIFAAKDLICGGIRRRIGDGTSTKIWGSPWLPDSDPMVHSIQPPYLSDTTVSGLIDPITNSWDVSILLDLFAPRDIDLIKRVPISPGYTDSWYWIDDLRGIYSVKSGYRRVRGSVAPLSSGVNIWNKLWNLKIPPRWNTFIWRAITNTLPTTSNLIQRRLDINPLCPLCAVQVEDVTHVLVCCDFAASVWSISQLDIPNGVDVSFPMWIQQAFNSVDGDAIIKVAAILYAIWNARNSAVWEAKVSTPASVVAVAVTTLQNWQHSQPSSSTTVPLHDQANYPPSHSRCHVDAAYDSITGRAAAGVVLLNPNGGFVAAMSTPLPFCDSAIMAETLACKEALSWLKNMNEDNVAVLTDCAILCGNLGTSSQILSYIGISTRDCLSILSSFISCAVYFIPRSVNGLAHALAGDCFSSLQNDVMFWDVVPLTLFWSF